MNAFAPLRAAIVPGLRDSLRLRLWLPLYAVSLIFGLVSAAPIVSGIGLRSPYLAELSGGGADAWVDAVLSDPPGAATALSLWTILTLGMIALSGGAYNFVSGAALCRWSNARGYVAGGARYFLTFALLGGMLFVLLAICAVAASLLGVALGWLALAVIALAAQLLNVLGELARALAVHRGRRNPFVALRNALDLVRHQPGSVLALAAAGLGMHALLLAPVAFAAGWSPHPLAAFIAQQALVLAWMWVKFLRLAWADQLVRAVSPGTAEAAPPPPPHGALART